MNSAESFRIIKEIMPEFKSRLYKNFDEIFSKNWRHSTDEGDFWSIDGTTGFEKALKDTLYSFDTPETKEVFDFYKNMPWDEADEWEWQLEQLLDVITFSRGRV